MAYKDVKNEHAFQIFNKDLKAGDFPEILFFYGEEDYLIEWAAKSLGQKFVDKSMFDIDFVKINEIFGKQGDDYAYGTTEIYS